MYYRARYYDPSLGQFVSPDTIVPDASSVLSYNRYLYTRGNPLNRVDPTGYKDDPTSGMGGGGGGILLYWIYKAAEAVQRYGPRPGEVVTGPEDLILGPGIGMLTEGSIAGAKSLFGNARINGVFEGTTQAIGEVGERIGARILRGVLRANGGKLYEPSGFDAAYHGFDDLYRNTETGRLAVVEYKTSSTGTLNLPTSNNGVQMSNRWIRHKTERMQTQSSSQYSEANSPLAKELRAELDAGLSVERVTVLINYADGNVSLYQPNPQGGWYRVGNAVSLD